MASIQTTFVSAFYDIYDSPNDAHPHIKSTEQRFRHFEQLLQTGISINLFTDNAGQFEKFRQQYSQTLTITVMPLQQINLHNILQNPEWKLPEQRTVSKDTRNYLTLMNLKTAFLVMAMNQNPASHFAWIDFNIAYIFKETEKTLRWIALLAKVASTAKHKELVFPGCWQNIQPITQYDSVSWRFCGGFFWGDRQSLLHFHDVFVEQVEHFIADICKGTLTWEVNYWGWLESTGKTNPVWYRANHNDTMITAFPPNFLATKPHFHYEQEMQFMDLGGSYLPMTSSHYYDDKTGKHWLNTRFVNYRLTETGLYIFLDGSGTIKTRNYLQELKVGQAGLFSGCGGAHVGRFLREDCLPIMGIKCAEPFSVGFEDMRLYSASGSQNIAGFVATNVEYSRDNRPQMAFGMIDLESATVDTVRVIYSGECEKNWIPLWDCERFIYGWSCEGIIVGNIGEVLCEGCVDIAKMMRIPYGDGQAGLLMSKLPIRGSSVFSKWREHDTWIGLVHWSLEGMPRRYFHMFVVLDGGFRVLSCSLPFVFRGEYPVEFCTAFHWDSCGNCFHFWISQMDRSPMYLVSMLDEFFFI